MNRNQAIQYNNNDEIIFSEENPETISPIEKRTWKVMIVDDDEDIHFLTKLVLRDFSFEDRKLSFISSYSGREAKELIVANPDTALIILDVIMEDMYAGLDVVKYIREELKNSMVRIILRTGQPGQEPEHKVVIQYDINDYKTKTELSSQKLFTSIVSALRSYENLKLIEKYREGTKLLLDSLAENCPNIVAADLTKGIMLQMIAMIDSEGSSMFIHRKQETSDLYIIAATGVYDGFSGKNAGECLSKEMTDVLEHTEIDGNVIEGTDCYICLHKSERGDFFLVLMGIKSLSESERKMISQFTEMLSCVNTKMMA